MIEIRRGTSQDMLEFWDGRYAAYAVPYAKRVESGEQEVWMARDTKNGKWVGELHLRWKDEDAQLADGKETAYLLAFRVEPDYQGKGIGKQIMQRVLQRAVERGIYKINIGVDEEEEKNLRMYQKWGFDKKVAESSFIDNGQIYPFSVYQKNMKNVAET
mgnify:CR=1 FL=1